MGTRQVRVVIGSVCGTPLIHQPVEVQFSVGNNWVPPTGPMKFPPPPPPPPSPPKDGGGAGKKDGGDGKAKGGKDNKGGKDGSDGKDGMGGKDDKKGGEKKGKGGEEKAGPKGSSNVGAVADAAWKAMQEEEARTKGDSVQTGTHPIAEGKTPDGPVKYPTGLGYMVDFTLTVKDEINVYVSDTTQVKIAILVEPGLGDFAVKFPTHGGTPTPPDTGGGGTPTPPEKRGGGTSTPPDGPIKDTGKDRVHKVPPGKGGWYILSSSGIATNGYIAGPMLGDQWAPLAAAPRSEGPAGDFLNTLGAPFAVAALGSADPSPLEMFEAAMFWDSDAELFAAPRLGFAPETLFAIRNNPLVPTGKPIRAHWGKELEAGLVSTGGLRAGNVAIGVPSEQGAIEAEAGPDATSLPRGGALVGRDLAPVFGSSPPDPETSGDQRLLGTLIGDWRNDRSSPTSDSKQVTDEGPRSR